MYMAFGVAIWGGVLIINWCFCQHYPSGKWKPHLKRIIFLKNFSAKMSWGRGGGRELRNKSWDKKVGILVKMLFDNYQTSKPKEITRQQRIANWTFHYPRSCSRLLNRYSAVLSRDRLGASVRRIRTLQENKSGTP